MLLSWSRDLQQNKVYSQASTFIKAHTTMSNDSPRNLILKTKVRVLHILDSKSFRGIIKQISLPHPYMLPTEIDRLPFTGHPFLDLISLLSERAQLLLRAANRLPWFSCQREKKKKETKRCNYKHVTITRNKRQGATSSLEENDEKIIGHTQMLQESRRQTKYSEVSRIP